MIGPDTIGELFGELADIELTFPAGSAFTIILPEGFLQAANIKHSEVSRTTKPRMFAKTDRVI